MSSVLLHTALALLRELATVPGAIDAIRGELVAMEAVQGGLEVGVDGKLTVAKKKAGAKPATFATLSKKKKWNRNDVQAAAKLFGADKLPKGMYGLLMGLKCK